MRYPCILDEVTQHGIGPCLVSTVLSTRTHMELIGYLGDILNAITVLSRGFSALVAHALLQPWSYLPIGMLLVRTTSYTLVS